jgi:peroxiredoxin
VQLRQKAEELDGLNIQVLAIAPDQPDVLAPLQKTLKLPYPLLGDPKQTVFEQYGLMEGNQPTGGNLILDGEGIVRYTYHGVTPDDRPKMSDLMDAAKAV